MHNQNGKTRSLRSETVLGLIWMVSQSLGTKLISVFGQLALAYLLLPEHFAAISLTYTVTAFARVLENGGLREVLVHRAAELEKWINPAFWLSLTLGLFSSLVIVLAAPCAAALYQSAEVWNLLLVLSISPILISFNTIPVATLQVQHRFQALAGIAALQGCSQIVATVCFAWLGWGAYSFVFGTLTSNVLYTLTTWSICFTRIQPIFEFTKWQNLWSDTLLLSLVGLATAVIQQVDYMMLGIFQSKLEVGLYFFAFGLATQTTQILSGNIAAVFLPILCKIQTDHQRQLQASLRALNILAAIGIPLSFLQCGLTDAGFRLFLPVKWLPAIPYAQVLSLGLGLNLLSSLCWSLLKSQGRFRTILNLNVVSAVVFSAAITATAAYGTPYWVSWVVVVFCAVYAPGLLLISILPIGGSIKHVLGVFCTPTIASTISLVVGWSLEQQVPQFEFTLVSRLVVVVLSFLLSYVCIMAITQHPLIGEVTRLFQSHIWARFPIKHK